MTQHNLGKVVVLMGGTSAEREISLRTGQAVLEALLRQQVDAQSLDPADDNFMQQLMATKCDRVFIALHGRGGEDGTMQGLLDNLNIPYTGSKVLGSALAMDKMRTKALWQGLGLPTPKSIALNEKSNFAAIVEELGLPIMVKPSLEGSSVGITKAKTLSELQQAWEFAKQYDCHIIAEQFIQGQEYTVGIIEEMALPLIHLITPHDFYDFEAKYNTDTTQYICPCDLPAEREQNLQALALEAFQAIGASSWGRVDLICDDNERPWLLEVNTIPGLTDHSLVPKAAKTIGIDFDELVLRILATATQ